MNGKKKDVKRSAIIGLIVFLGLMVALWAIYQANAPTTNTGVKAYTLTVIDDAGEKTAYTATTDAECVGRALVELEEAQAFTMQGTESEYGFFLDAVNGCVADYTVDGSYWAFYLNDEYATVGIDQQPLSDGDHIELRYER